MTEHVIRWLAKDQASRSSAWQSDVTLLFCSQRVFAGRVCASLVLCHPVPNGHVKTFQPSARVCHAVPCAPILFAKLSHPSHRGLVSSTFFLSSSARIPAGPVSLGYLLFSAYFALLRFSDHVLYPSVMYMVKLLIFRGNVWHGHDFSSMYFACRGWTTPIPLCRNFALYTRIHHQAGLTSDWDPNPNPEAASTRMLPSGAVYPDPLPWLFQKLG